MEFRVLAVDDEIELLDALELYMNRDNMTLLKAKDGIEAIEKFQKEEPHIVLLDVMMPGLDGFSVLRKIRESSKIPAIMLTAKDADYDKILGLELGADDYITKPYNPLEVVARVKAQLRRAYNYEVIKENTEELSCFDVVLNTQEGSVKKSGVSIPLTRTEFRILSLLMEHPGRIYTKQQIYEYVWDGEVMPDDSTVMVHISNLRSKIEDDVKNPRILKTIKGLGYKIEKESDR